ncbi:MAG: HAMP domain-containing protein [Parachlamydiaceae bacterium]
MTIRTRLLCLLLPVLIAFIFFDSFFFYFHLSREILLIGSLIILVLGIGAVYLIADRISKPVRQLNQAALQIAAGDYEANIHVKGPREIKELAQTLNTMSQCLVEHMSRLKESSLIRERMYGEYECSLLLEYYMLQKVIEDFTNPYLTMRLIAVPQSPLQKGLFLKIDRLDYNGLIFTFLESQEPGFQGLFNLNQLAHASKEERNGIPFIECQFIDQYHRLRYHAHTLFPPLVWSMNNCRLIKGDSQGIPIENLDMIFLYNSSVIDHFKSPEVIEEWFSRVLRHFSKDGLDAIQLMLTNELTFLAKKQHIKHNFKIIGLQVKIK